MATLATPFEGKVDISRPRKLSPDFAWAILLYSSIAAHAILSFVIFASKNTETPVIYRSTINNTGWVTSECPTDYMSQSDCISGFVHRERVIETMDCITESLCMELKTCASNNPGSGSRRLSAEEVHGRRLAAKDAKNVWQFLEQHFYQPTVLFGSVFACAGLWLVALDKAPKAVVWGTMIMDILLLVAIFVWFYIETESINWACIVLAALMAIGCVVARKQINNACVMMRIAMDGLFANKRLFAVTFGVQCVWVAFFALWIAGIIGMHFVQEALPDPDPNWDGRCSIQVAWTGNGGLQVYWILHYYWTTYFFRNINVFLITVNISGWYFKEDSYKSFWVQGLEWVLGPMAGGTAICSAVIGILEYLLSRVSSPCNIILGILNPLEWIFVCIGLCLKTVAMTYTKFGVIAMAHGGRPFCETAPKAFQVLRAHLGDAVVTDYVGKRVMAWCTYAVALAVAFRTWEWGDHVQEIAVEIPTHTFIAIMALYAWLISYPFVGLIFVIFLEQGIGGIAEPGSDVRKGMNSIFASVFMGCISYFLLNFLSGVVVSAMDAVLFCFAVEESLGQKQAERFDKLYGSIKETFAVGTVVGSSEGVVVVVGTAPGGQTPAGAVGATGTAWQPPVAVVGQPMPAEPQDNSNNA